MIMVEREGSILMPRTGRIIVPTENGEKRYAIRTIDWERLRRKIEHSEIPSRRTSNIYSALIGFCASTIMNYLSIYQSNEILPFVKAFYLCAIIFSAFGSYVFYKQDEENRRSYNRNVKEILTDMDDIESTYGQISE